MAQGFTGWPSERSGGRIKSEADPLDANPPASMRRALQAIRRLEVMVSTASELAGVVLRYGLFYGPSTSVSHEGEFIEAARHRKFPIIGGDAGVWSWIHIDDCARATQIAVQSATSSGIYNIVDDEPAEVSVWLPYLAQALGAKAPLRVPAWIGRLLVGEPIVLFMTKIRGSSNALAKRVLKWQPQYASCREGFRSGLE
ncbi:MAG TPA: NAD-dependent epimerase/dehydratase family protein [Candidatus Polarisedimenticolia bacterium]|nr:NAD-dependent epimerase/dehydratase family protein [Candidatus Polarisedimenticolia bacterium]